MADGVRWLLGALMAAAGVASLCGNLLLLLLLLLDRELRSEARGFTVSLALSDLALGLSALPLGAYNSLSGGAGPGSGGALCQGSAFLLLLLQTSSLHSLAWATARKFTEIRFALSHGGLWTAGRSRAALVLVWAFGLLCAALPLLGAGRYAYSAPRFLCVPSFTPEHRLFAALWMAAGVAAPVLSTCLLYGCMVHAARQQARRGTFRCNEQHCFYVPANAYLRSSVVMVTNSVSLLLCWLPYAAVCLYESFSGQQSPPAASGASCCLVLSSAAFNPWILCLTQTYRRAARRVIRSCSWEESRPQSSALRLASANRISTTTAPSSCPPSLPKPLTSSEH